MQQRAAKSSPACASCKYQRRKCGPNCPLAPFFPAHLQREFLNAHRLFGVSNIVKITANLDPHQKKIAMNSIIYQGNVRAGDPVGGCYRIICDLQQQIDFATAQLEMVRTQIAICKTQLAREVIQGEETVPAVQGLTIDVDDDDDFEMYDAGRAPVPAMEYRQQGVHYENQLGQHKQKVIVHDYGGNYGLSSQVYEVFDRGSVKTEMAAESSPFSTVHGKNVFADLGEDENQIIGGLHERDARLVPCSNKNVFKEEVQSIQQEQKIELKDAASSFSLTNGER
ncbi:hypothetical protein SLEP1_g15885 [Rubroshorea leprosula]|uniref:LOB domain-containing protein n=1 Tax=Rubroshorea leprosula TaxID=152421 RepID=A0AAV5IZM2_9ROSI|nr:hypothetical protein SLEP1_g15885 [Rubroshorea leprosula]